MKSKIKKLLLVSFLAFLLFLGFIKLRSFWYDDEGLPLAVRWEGLYHHKNFRDVGGSVNQCLGQDLFKTEVALRANGWFSGWSCDDVGEPDILYSLNYSPSKEERYYCWDGEKNNIGRFFNPEIQLHDLEFLKNWSDPKMRDAACGFFNDIFQAIIAQKKVLLHCSAGRDRTGTYSALLIALAAEESKKLDNTMLDAIECDYRKTESLVPDKFGRMKNFILDIQKKEGSVAQFFQNQCGTDVETLKRAAAQINL